MGVFFLFSFPLSVDQQAYTKTSIISVCNYLITICNQVAIGNPEYPALALFLNLWLPSLEFFEIIFEGQKKEKMHIKETENDTTQSTPSTVLSK